jgi:Ser/Thr protein kinase RdoA (MazF antagonist)
MATIASPAPYAALTPPLIADALDSVGLWPDGRLLALNSYENRVWQVGIEDDAPVIAKFYRPGRWSDAQILEEHAFVDELVEADVPVVAPLRLAGRTLHDFEGFRFAVYPRRGGRAPELDRRGTLERLGRYIARIHTVGASHPFAQRPALTVEAFGGDSRAYLLDHRFVPEDLVAAWTAIVDMALAAVRRAFDRTRFDVLRVHGDCHASNVLWTDDGPHFVDFDDARMAPAIQDLWMLLSGSRTSMEEQLHELLEGYESFRDFDRGELALIEPLRTLRLLHYSAWIARRWDDPAFPAAFPWFGSQRYWQDRILELREQAALMDEPPLAAP